MKYTTHRKTVNPSFYERDALKAQHTAAQLQAAYKRGTRSDLLTVAAALSIGAATQYAKGIGARPEIKFGRRRNGRFRDAREAFYGLAEMAAIEGVDCWRAGADNRTARLAKLARARRSFPGFSRYVFAAVDYRLGQVSLMQHAHGPGFGPREAYGSGYVAQPDGSLRAADPDLQLATLVHHHGIDAAGGMQWGTPQAEPESVDERADARTLERFKAQHGERMHDLATAVQPYTAVSQRQYVARGRRRKDYKSDADYQRAHAEFAAELDRACDLLHVSALWGAPTFAGRSLPPGLQFWVDYLEVCGRYTLRPGAKFPKGEEVHSPEGQAVLMQLYQDLLPTLQAVRGRRGKR